MNSKPQRHENSACPRNLLPLTTLRQSGNRERACKRIKLYGVETEISQTLSHNPRNNADAKFRTEWSGLAAAGVDEFDYFFRG